FGKTADVPASSDATLPVSSDATLSAKSEVILPTQDAYRPSYLFLTLMNLAYNTCYNDGEEPQICYKLQVTDSKKLAPPAAVEHLGCSEAASCFINIRTIEFDNVYSKSLYNDGSARQVHYTIVVSKDAPMLSKLIKYCARTLYDVEHSQKVVATTCYNVTNFSFGQ
ncbi:MAG: hypothetical protein H7235_00540, partial [Bdellovibrionaceae bacterium]|nr:hypothetical protein [Pseudobdellovibrionaceae bacterium]